MIIIIKKLLDIFEFRKADVNSTLPSPHILFYDQLCWKGANGALRFAQ